jgi:hypothetical protein
MSQQAPVFTTILNHVFRQMLVLEAGKPVGTFLQDNDQQALAARLESECMTAIQQLFPLIGSPLVRDLNTLTSLPLSGDVQSSGWYLIVLREHSDPSWYRLYVGQTNNLARRVKEHQNPTYRKHQGHKFLYKLWEDPDRYGQVYTLGQTQSTDQLYLNVVEHVWAVALQTLESEWLQPWMADGVALYTSLGANISSPLAQYLDSAGWPPWYLGFRSEDPEKRAFCQAVIDKGQATHEATDYVLIRTSQRATMSKRSTNGPKYRGPVGDDPQSVELYCHKCGDKAQTYIETLPTYSIRTGRFVARQRRKCKNCPLTPHELRKKRQKIPSTFFVPVSEMIPWVLDNQLGKEPGDNYPSKPRWMRRAAAEARKKAADDEKKRDAEPENETIAAAAAADVGGGPSVVDEAVTVSLALLVSNGA